MKLNFVRKVYCSEDIKIYILVIYRRKTMRKLRKHRKPLRKVDKLLNLPRYTNSYGLTAGWAFSARITLLYLTETLYRILNK